VVLRIDAAVMELSIGDAIRLVAGSNQRSTYPGTELETEVKYEGYVRRQTDGSERRNGFRREGRRNPAVASTFMPLLASTESVRTALGVCVREFARRQGARRIAGESAAARSRFLREQSSCG